jgi:GTP-binding protein LepA
VSRSLAACEGALLVVDATQGVQAQTIANVHLAIENNLELIPVINKIDLPTAQPEKAIEEIENTIGLIDCSRAIQCSAKTGEGVSEILESIVTNLPPPKGSPSNPLQALIFDSYYDPFRGVVVFIRVINGEIKKTDKIFFLNSKREYEVSEIGIMKPGTKHPVEFLRAGEVGYLAANIKSITDARVGDTITLAKCATQVSPLPGYESAKQMVFASIYPSNADDYETLRDAINKLKLNDASLFFQPETSTAMGFGFRCGFLGLLHMDIVQERLEREYDLDLIITAPSVIYKVILKKNLEETFIQSPAKLPEPHFIEEIQEPYVKLEMLSPSDHIGALMSLAQAHRGEFKEMKFLTTNRTSLIYEVCGLNLFFACIFLICIFIDSSG